MTVSHPTILVEVLSPSARGVDTGRKLAGYLELASVAHYLVLDSEARVATHHHRSGGRIMTNIVRGGGILLNPPGIELRMADLFASITSQARTRTEPDSVPFADG